MKQKLFLLTLLVFCFWNCDENEQVDNSGDLEITNINLPELPSGYTYEGWLDLGEIWVSVGTFNQNEENPISEKTFNNIDVYDLEDAQGFYVTVETTSGNSTPSDFILLHGTFNGDATLVTMDELTIAVQESGSNVSGQYTLATPSTNSITDELNGIWFMNTANEAGLNLNLGNEGGELQYQAWLQLTGTSGETEYLNIGKFEATDIADDSHLFSSTEAETPLFPGEDFINYVNGIDLETTYFPLNLAGKTLLVQPTPQAYENSDQPFGVNFLSAEISANPSANTVYTMDLENGYSVSVER